MYTLTLMFIVTISEIHVSLLYEETRMVGPLGSDESLIICSAILTQL